MATSNIVVTPTPQKVVNANVDFLLSIPSTKDVNIHLATTATPGVAPTVDIWHQLRASKFEQVNRTVLVSNEEVWIKCNKGKLIVVLEV